MPVPRPSFGVPFDGDAEQLASIGLFRELDAGALTALASVATVVSLEAGEPLIRQGEPGEALYVLLDGEVDVVRELAGGARQAIARLGAGECVGEMALLTKRDRSATVVARAAVRALRLGAEEVEQALAHHPDARRLLADFAARRLPSLRLASTGLFVDVDASALERFDHDENWIRLRGGDALFVQGEPGDAMYVVVHGSLEVLIDQGTSHGRLVDVLGPGSSIGEMALLTDDPRSATVRAIRDSELVRVSRAEFARLLDEHPRIAIELARLLARRLRETTSAPRVFRYARTLALIPATRAGMPPAFAPRLVAAIEAPGGAVLRLSSTEVDAALGPGAAQTLFDDLGNARLLNWLNERQERYRYVVYECDAEPSPWTQRCLRQADALLVVADARGDPEPGEIEQMLIGPTASGGAGRRPRYELVLLHADEIAQPSGTAAWLDARGHETVAAVHHIRVGRNADCARLARSVSGASLGLALSGGGARGFAEIGVLRALAERGLEVDSVGGTSMGAVMGGLCALGYDWRTIVERSREAFVGYPVVRDLTAPTIALMRGRSSVRLLRHLFGDVQIEDLWIPYFCVSTNLTRAQSVVHDRGPLWRWTRASSSIPGIAPPVPHHGDLLVDGGVLNNLPADVMRARCRGSVIAVDVGAAIELRTDADADDTEMSGWPRLARTLNPFDRRPPFPNILRILSRTATLASVRDQDAMRDVADLYLHPPTDDVDPLDWTAIDRVVEIGYRHARDGIAAWLPSRRHATPVHSAVRRTGSLEARA